MGKHLRKINLYSYSIRISFFIVYFWFGILKVLDVSSATPLMTDLLHLILPSAPIVPFIVFFGIFEMIIGLLFLIPNLTRFVTFLAIVHLIPCILPLFILPSYTWSSWGVLDLTGQYIIKNVFIVSSLITLNYIYRQEEE